MGSNWPNRASYEALAHFALHHEEPGPSQKGLLGRAFLAVSASSGSPISKML